MACSTLSCTCEGFRTQTAVKSCMAIWRNAAKIPWVYFTFDFELTFVTVCLETSPQWHFIASLQWKRAVRSRDLERTGTQLTGTATTHTPHPHATLCSTTVCSGRFLISLWPQDDSTCPSWFSFSAVTERANIPKPSSFIDSCQFVLGNPFKLYPQRILELQKFNTGNHPNNDLPVHHV